MWVRTLIGTLILFWGSLEGFALKDHLDQARVGDFFVAVYNKHYLLVSISQVDNRTLLIEESVIPVARKPRHLSWQQWLLSGSPEATSKGLYRIEKDSGTVQELSSQVATKSPMPSHHFFATLINLPLDQIPLDQRRRSGKGALWQPRMVFHGNTLANVSFDGWIGWWPEDGSPLSRKSIELYLPTASTNFPAYFPYWLKVYGLEAEGGGILYLLDSGNFNL